MVGALPRLQARRSSPGVAPGGASAPASPSRRGRKPRFAAGHRRRLAARRGGRRTFHGVGGERFQALRPPAPGRPALRPPRWCGPRRTRRPPRRRSRFGQAAGAAVEPGFDDDAPERHLRARRAPRGYSNAQNRLRPALQLHEFHSGLRFSRNAARPSLPFRRSAPLRDAARGFLRQRVVDLMPCHETHQCFCIRDGARRRSERQIAQMLHHRLQARHRRRPRTEPGRSFPRYAASKLSALANSAFAQRGADCLDHVRRDRRGRQAEAHFGKAKSWFPSPRRRRRTPPPALRRRPSRRRAPAPR